MIFILPTLENDKKALATHRLRHRDRAVSFSKIQADIYLYTFVGHLFVYSLVNEFIQVQELGEWLRVTLATEKGKVI